MAHRILEVFEAVAHYGPISLDDLTDHLPRSRSSVYRALIALHEAGWIRKSMNGRSYYLSSRLEKLCDLQYSFADDVCDLLDALSIYSRNNKCAIAAVALVKGLEFIVLDTNTFPVPSNIVCPVEKEILGQVTTAIRKSGLMRGYPAPNHDDISAHEKMLVLKLQSRGFIYFGEMHIGVIPLRMGSGEFIFLVIEEIDLSPTSRDKTVMAIQEIIDLARTSGATTFQLSPEGAMVAE